MSETENDYVATATAEKRLREVLAERFGGSDGIDGGELAYRVGDILLAVAEITYLPRKKSVSIVLQVPETAQTPTPKSARNGATTEAPPSAIADETDGACPRCGGDGCPACTATPEPAPDKPKPARFGLYEPTVTSAPEYHDDDFFTE